LYGVKTFFKQSSNWQLVHQETDINEKITERLVFKHSSKKVFLIADAYLGHKIKDAIFDLIDSAYGCKKESISLEIESPNYDL